VFVSIRSLSGNSPCLCSLSVDWRLCASTVTTSYRCACPWDTTGYGPNHDQESRARMRAGAGLECRRVVARFRRWLPVLWLLWLPDVARHRRLRGAFEPARGPPRASEPHPSPTEPPRASPPPTCTACPRPGRHTRGGSTPRWSLPPSGGARRASDRCTACIRTPPPTTHPPSACTVCRRPYSHRRIRCARLHHLHRRSHEQTSSWAATSTACQCPPPPPHRRTHELPCLRWGLHVVLREWGAVRGLR
jgi:hypothetical protein